MGVISEKIDKQVAILSAELTVPLAADSDPASTARLRAQLAQAEAHSITMAMLKNDLSQVIDQKKAEALDSINADYGEAAKTMKVGEKKILIQSRTAKLVAYDTLLDGITKILEKRVSAAQTLLNNINTEIKTGWAGKNHEVQL